MSYDYPDGYEPGPPVKMTLRERIAHWWWGVVLWAALDARWAWVNRWGMRRLYATPVSEREERQALKRRKPPPREE